MNNNILRFNVEIFYYKNSQIDILKSSSELKIDNLHFIVIFHKLSRLLIKQMAMSFLLQWEVEIYPKDSGNFV